jgi:hypothetical protein
MKTKLALSAFIISTSLLSSAAFAHGGDHDGWYDQRHHRHHGWRPAPAHVVYAPPRSVYVRPPVAYYQPAYRPAYYAQPAYAPAYYAPARAYYGGDRVAGQVVGAVAGGVIGNAVSGGALAPTAIGAVLGGLIGGDLAD